MTGVKLKSREIVFVDDIHFSYQIVKICIEHGSVRTLRKISKRFDNLIMSFWQAIFFRDVSHDDVIKMEEFSALLAICAGKFTGEFHAQRPLTRSFDVNFDLRPNKRLSKQSWGCWFETPLWSLWRQCNEKLQCHDVIMTGVKLKSREIVFVDDIHFSYQIVKICKISKRFDYLIMSFWQAIFFRDLSHDDVIKMEAFSASLAICAGNSPVPGEFHAQRPVTRSFDVNFDLCPNKRLSKQSWSWWFETPPRPLWRHRNG